MLPGLEKLRGAWRSACIRHGRRLSAGALAGALALFVTAAWSRASAAVDLNEFTLRGIYHTPSPVPDVQVRGHLAYVAYAVDTSTVVLEILDVTHPDAITPVGSVAITHPVNDFYGPYAITLAGERAYIAMYSGGFVICDISNPAAPQRLGSYDVNGGWGDAMHVMIVENNVLYVGWDYNHGLGIFDVSDPTAPQLLSELGGIGFARTLLKKDNYVFVATYYNNYVQIVNVANPQLPQIVAAIPTPGSSYYIGDIAGDILYLGDRSATYGLRVYNVANPMAPVLLAQVDTAALGFGDVGNARLFGDQLLVTFPGRVAAFAVNPQDPTVAPTLSSVMNTGYENRMFFAFVDNKIYLPGETGLHLFGVPDTQAPQLSVTVTPEALWPPNHNLVTVNATVQVQDNQDPNPQVVLTSITSSDVGMPMPCPACVQEANFGTLDTSFKLLATRTGGGLGRTYVITYTATDASGNSQAVSALVTVPHDQGR